MTTIAQAYAAATVREGAREDRDQLPAARPEPRHPHTVWDDLPVIPSGLDQEEPF